MLGTTANHGQKTPKVEVSMLAGLVLSSCCAVVSAVLSADMSEKALVGSEVLGRNNEVRLSVFSKQTSLD